MMMTKQKQIALIALLAFWVLSGCSSHTKYLQHLSNQDRAQISTLAVEVSHDIEPGMHAPLILYTERPSGSTTERIGGYPFWWTMERYSSEAEALGRKVNTQLAQLPAGYFEKIVLASLAEYGAREGRVSLANEAGASAQLKLSLYYMTAPDYGYAGLHARIYNKNGVRICDRTEFSHNWNPASIEKDLASNIEDFLRNATKTIWRDISG